MTNLFIGIVCAKAEGLSRLWDSTYAFMSNMASWAGDHGYETWTFTDEDKPLHVDSIRDFIKAQHKKIEADPTGSHGLYNRTGIFIYFCGHGFLRGRQEPFWMLSNGLQTHDDRIDVMNMRDVLDEYEPEFIRIFSDACAEARDLNGGGRTMIPGSMRGKEYYSPAPIDMFAAAVKNATTLADANGPVFSQFVRRGLLEGHKKAYSEYVFPTIWAESHNEPIS